MKHLTTYLRQSYHNRLKLVLLLLVTFSCNSSDSNLYQIDPRTFIENEISLSEIADDVTYIPLDNSHPISIIYYTSLNILKNSIYLSARDIGIIRLNRDGSLVKVIGKRGRGPGEWYYCMSVAVDDRSETIYVMDDNNEIKVYSKNGEFKGNLKLPESEDGFGFAGLTFYNSNLFASQYINMGHSKYCWIILDTLGNIISQKLNPIPTFSSNMGAGGGVYKFDNNVFYWNWYNDTIYSISENFDYKASHIFSLGDRKIPLGKIDSKDFIETISKYYLPASILETKRYLLYRYGYNKKGSIALIDKKTTKTYLAYADSRGGGIKNDIDGGLMFNPVHYFTENDREFLLGLIDPFQLKNYISSAEFIKSSPIYPEKKNTLKTLANKIKEADNQILMIVKLKK